MNKNVFDGSGSSGTEQGAMNHAPASGLGYSHGSADHNLPPTNEIIMMYSSGAS
jgi:hypothetical protein